MFTPLWPLISEERCRPLLGIIHLIPDAFSLFVYDAPNRSKWYATVVPAAISPLTMRTSMYVLYTQRLQRHLITKKAWNRFLGLRAISRWPSAYGGLRECVLLCSRAVNSRSATSHVPCPTPSVHGTRLVQSQHLALLPQVLDVLCPILLGTKRRKGAGKGGVLMMAQHPGRIANHAQRPQGLNEAQTVAVQ